MQNEIGNETIKNENEIDNTIIRGINLQTIYDTYKDDDNIVGKYYIKPNKYSFEIPNAGQIISNIEILYYNSTTNKTIPYNGHFKLSIGGQEIFVNDEYTTNEPNINALIPLLYLQYHSVVLDLKNQDKEKELIMIKVIYNNFKGNLPNYSNYRIYLDFPDYKGVVGSGMANISSKKSTIYEKEDINSQFDIGNIKHSIYKIPFIDTIINLFTIKDDNVYKNNCKANYPPLHLLVKSKEINNKYKSIDIESCGTENFIKKQCDNYHYTDTDYVSKTFSVIIEIERTCDLIDKLIMNSDFEIKIYDMINFKKKYLGTINKNNNNISFEPISLLNRCYNKTYLVFEFNKEYFNKFLNMSFIINNIYLEQNERRLLARLGEHYNKI